MAARILHRCGVSAAAVHVRMASRPRGFSRLAAAYRELGLLPDGSCTDADLAKAYRAAALRWHPDRFETEEMSVDKARAAKKFRQLTDAFEHIQSTRRDPTVAPAAASSQRPESAVAAATPPPAGFWRRPDDPLSRKHAPDSSGGGFGADFGEFFRSAARDNGAGYRARRAPPRKTSRGLRDWGFDWVSWGGTGDYGDSRQQPQMQARTKQQQQFRQQERAAERRRQQQQATQSSKQQHSKTHWLELLRISVECGDARTVRACITDGRIDGLHECVQQSQMWGQRSALHLAAKNGHAAVVAELLHHHKQQRASTATTRFSEAGRQSSNSGGSGSRLNGGVNALDARGNSPLLLAVTAASTTATAAHTQQQQQQQQQRRREGGAEWQAVVKMLLNSGADPSLCDELGCTALHYCRRLSIGRLLLTAGADPAIVNYDGWNAAEFQVRRNPGSPADANRILCSVSI
eukprot:COSAG05_NODE_860_length_6900_cov_15.221291_3_plen_463_part_00